MIISHSRLFLIFLLCVTSLGGCTPRWARVTAEPLHGSSHIPSEMRYGKVYVFASLNGSEPMRMLLDTGAYTNTVTETAAEQLGLIRRGKQLVTDFHGNTERYDLAVVESMQLGPLTLRNFEVTIKLDRSMPETLGVIGMLGIQNSTLDIDFNTGRVELSDKQLDADTPGVVEFKLSPEFKAKIPIDIQTGDGAYQRVWAVLDTGFNGSITLNRKDSRRFTRSDGLIIHDRAYGTHGPSKSWAADGYLLEGDVKFGDLVYSQVVATVNQRANNLGVELLEGCRITIDWPSRLFRIERADGATRMVDLMSYWIDPADDGNGRLIAPKRTSKGWITRKKYSRSMG